MLPILVSDLIGVIDMSIMCFLGEIIGAHINTTHPGKEDDLSNAWNDLLVDPMMYGENCDLQNSMDDLRSLHHIPVVATEAKQSIMVYTYCKTPEDMKNYVKMLNSGQLQTVFENILNNLLRKLEGENFVPLEAAVMLEEEDKILVQKFTGLNGKYKYLTHFLLFVSLNFVSPYYMHTIANCWA